MWWCICILPVWHQSCCLSFLVLLPQQSSFFVFFYAKDHIYTLGKEEGMLAALLKQGKKGSKSSISHGCGQGKKKRKNMQWKWNDKRGTELVTESLLWKKKMYTEHITWLAISGNNWQGKQWQTTIRYILSIALLSNAHTDIFVRSI